MFLIQNNNNSNNNSFIQLQLFFFGTIKKTTRLINDENMCYFSGLIIIKKIFTELKKYFLMPILHQILNIIN